jgi:hypothetical protein
MNVATTEPSCADAVPQAAVVIGIVFGKMEKLTRDVLSYLLLYQTSCYTKTGFKERLSLESSPHPQGIHLLSS